MWSRSTSAARTVGECHLNDPDMQQDSGCSRFHRSCSTQMRRGGRRQPHEVLHPLPESRLDDVGVVQDEDAHPQGQDRPEQDARFVDALGMRPIPPEAAPRHGPAGERFPVDHHAGAKDDIGGQDEHEGEVGPRHGAALAHSGHLRQLSIRPRHRRRSISPRSSGMRSNSGGEGVEASGAAAAGGTWASRWMRPSGKRPSGSRNRWLRGPGGRSARH